MKSVSQSVSQSISWSVKPVRQIRQLVSLSVSDHIFGQIEDISVNEQEQDDEVCIPRDCSSL